MAEKQKMGWAERLAMGGTVVTVVGHVIYLGAGSNTTGAIAIAGNLVKLLGIGLFMGAVVLALRQFSTEIHELARTQAAAQQALAIGESGLLIRTLDQWTADNPRAIHVKAAMAVAKELLDSNTIRLLRKIDDFHSQSTDEIELRNVLSVQDLLEHLAKELPKSGVWLAHVIRTRRLWSEADVAFGGFARVVRARSDAGEIALLRLYRYVDDAELQAIKVEDSILPSRSNNRYARVSGLDRDVALLYAPSNKTKSAFVPSEGQDVVEALHQAGYNLLCVLSFDTAPDGSLSAVKVHRDTGSDAKGVPGQVGLIWKLAKST
jgi:hypothetical protein